MTTDAAPQTWTWDYWDPEHDLAVLERFQPGARQRYAQRARFDRAAAATWLHYNAGLLGRDALDLRTRLLVIVGQFTMLRNAERLDETIEAALDGGIDPREVLEVVLQCAIYGGESPSSTNLSRSSTRS